MLLGAAMFPETSMAARKHGDRPGDDGGVCGGASQKWLRASALLAQERRPTIMLKEMIQRKAFT